ncbi:hypothetical protein [Streptomyces sp. NPDC088925]|uniref:hypothetical protein n=1 Tax=Streptomyces sp. NPDC088925 TaxID=3365914 RepID=UPI0038307F95
MISLTLEPTAPPLPATADRPMVAAMLRATPGRWTLLGARANAASLRQMSYSLRTGVGGWTDFGRGFETSMLSLGDEHRLYVRYMADGVAV